MRRFFGPALLSLLAVAPVAAQVGHDPDKSPFRPIEHGMWLEVYGGRLAGNGGPIPVGPRDGPLFGARIDFRGRNTLQLSLGGWYSSAERWIINAQDSVASRIQGPVRQRVGAFEVNVQFNITGSKSWRSIAPYLGLGLGLAMGEGAPAADTSGYAFGSKVYFSPNIGTRLFVTSRLHLKAEARATLWKIKYPTSYAFEPVKDPGTIDEPHAVNPGGKPSDYALAPKLILGFGWAF